jgi:hypothetical protein
MTGRCLQTQPSTRGSLVRLKCDCVAERFESKLESVGVVLRGVASRRELAE